MLDQYADPPVNGVYRTPDHRFSNLEDYPFSPNYLHVTDRSLGALRLHYLDEGPRSGPLVVCFHGEPTWSYLYRKMIPGLTEAGCRVLAPDLIGFGKSDKPIRKSHYSYAGMVEYMTQFIDQLDIQNATLFAQDWGGLISLRVLSSRPDRFARVVLSNTALPEGRPRKSAEDRELMPREFRMWRLFSRYSPVFPIQKIVGKGVQSSLAPDEERAYLAPFPEGRAKAAARIMPSLVPMDEDDPGAEDNRAAWSVLEAWKKPFLTVFGEDDPITVDWEKEFIMRVPGAAGEPHTRLANTGHFSQEDNPKALVSAILDQLRRQNVL